MTALQETIKTTPKYLHHVLLLEDEPSVANGLKMVLTDYPYRGGLWYGFDLVVADLRLPDINGMCNM